MQDNRVWLSVGVVIAILLVGGIFFVSRRESSSGSGSVATSTTGTTTVSLGNGQTVTLPPGVTLNEATSSSSAPTPPLLTGSIYMSPSLDADAQAALTSQENALIPQLKANPLQLDLWLELGVDRKIAGDYPGAITAWDYVAAFKSNLQYVAYGDLGDLYMNFDVNYPKAEAEYKAAIALDPQDVDYYSDLYTLYSSFYKQNTSAAADILAQGLKANPGNQELLALQAQLQGSAH